jgi:site-specific recombinase XerD
MRMAILEDGSAAPTSGALVLPANTSPSSPASVYLASLSLGSRRTMGQALGVLGEILLPGAAIENVPWHAVRYEHAMAIRARLAEKYAPSSANKILAALRGVSRAAFGLRSMSAEDLQRVVSVKGVRGTRLPKGRSISRVELEKLFAECDTTTNRGARDAALLAVLYAGGLRRSEAVGLDLADLDRANETIRIVGKGNKERTMYLTNGARRAVLAWVDRRGEASGPLFTAVSPRGRVGARQMSSQTVLDIVNGLAGRAGIAHLSPHDFRRAFVGDLLDAGVDLATVQAMAAHASPVTTARYDLRGQRARRRAAETLVVPYGE